MASHRFSVFWMGGILFSAACGANGSARPAVDTGTNLDAIVVEGRPLSSPDAGPSIPSAQDAFPRDTLDAAWWTFQSVDPSYPTTTAQGGQGDVTTYGGVNVSLTSSGGACGYGATGIHYYAAINEHQVPGDRLGNWNNGRICGQCARVWAVTKTGIKESFVRITDRCADGFCGIDLGGAPAAEIMDDSPGRYTGGWEFTACAGHPQVSDGPIALYIKNGSSLGWSAIQVRNPDYPVAAIQWGDTVTGQGGEIPYANGIFNFYLVPLAALSTPNPIQITARFTDGSTKQITLTPAQLGTAEATYPFP